MGKPLRAVAPEKSTGACITSKRLAKIKDVMYEFTAENLSVENDLRIGFSNMSRKGRPQADV